jgi:hypothetical protein
MEVDRRIFFPKESSETPQFLSFYRMKKSYESCSVYSNHVFIKESADILALINFK